MDRENEPVPPAHLEPPTEDELNEIIDLLVDPKPKQEDGWYDTRILIKIAMGEDPTLTEEAVRGRLKKAVKDNKLEKIAHQRMNYYRKVNE